MRDNRNKVFAVQKRHTNIERNQLTDGKMPPQAIELEELVLGAVMLENCVNIVIDILKPESFYKDAHCRIYESILRLANQSNPVDISTVIQELKKSGELDIVGGAYYVSQLTNKVASSANTEYHARIIAQKFIQREVIRIGTESIQKAYDDGCDVFDLLENTEKNIFKITEGNVKSDFESTSKLIKKTLEQIEKNGNSVDNISGVPSGLQALDKITGGWQKQNLIIIASRPAMGKSAFVLTIANNAAFDFNRKVGLFSLEMSKNELMERLISSEAEINNRKLRSGKLEDYEWTQINNHIAKFYKENLFIDDTPGISVFELRAKARRLKEKHNIELLIVDYLQLMTAESNGYGNREQEISFISRSLKGLAKELDIPVIALSQLSRAVETRGGSAKPKLSDLRESGAIEQDADMVGFLYRPEYYDIKDDGHGNQFEGGEGFLLIEKHRNGALDDAKFRFIGEYTKFVDWAEPLKSTYSGKELSPNYQFEKEGDDLPF